MPHADIADEEWVLAASSHPQTPAQAAAFQQHLLQQQSLVAANVSTPSKGKASEKEETKEDTAAAAAAAPGSAGSSERKKKYRTFLHRLIIPTASTTNTATLTTAPNATGSSNNLQPLSPLSARSSSSSSFSSHSSASPMPLHNAAPPLSPNPPSSSPLPVTPTSPAHSYHAVYGSADLLTFETDDIIHVIAKDIDAANPGWWYGEVVGDNKSKPGRFPGYLTVPVCSPEAAASSYSPSTSAASTLTSTDTAALPVVEDESSKQLDKQQRLVDKIRERVSKKKRRYQRDGYDLDLSYITPSIIAMGFPSESIEGLYRNRMQDVQQFLSSRHGDRFKVYNLCSERSYPADRFPHTARYPFDDHQPSSMDMISSFCEDAHAWLSQGSDYVVATHCKAGKGRTGFMIACYLLYSGMFTEAEEALRFYAIRRTKNAKGVTIPSQIRFTHYYQKLLQSHTIPYAPSTACLPSAAASAAPASNPVLLLAIRFNGIPRTALNKEVSFTLKQNDGSTYTSSRSSLSVVRSSPPSPPSLTLTSASSSRGLAAVQGDVQCVFHASTRFDSVKLFQCWFSTRFLGDHMDGVRCRRETESVRRVERPESTTGAAEGADSGALAAGVCDAIHGDRWELVLTKAQLDKACKDVKHSNFPPDFRVEMLFAHVL